MNCDRLAPVYRSVELAAFGTRLERHRFQFLDRVVGARRALILGEGDGRFLARLLTVNLDVRVDCLDISAGMLALARSRIALSASNNRVRFIHADAREWRFESAAYDLVVTNFFLDCFETAELTQLIDSIVLGCQPHASWLITEFQQPSSGWRALHGAAWLAMMYAFFRVATDLRVTRLPAYHSILDRAGFRPIARKLSFGDLVTSELWLRSL